MNITYPKPTTVTARAIRCFLPVNYDEEREALADFPGFGGSAITLVLNLDTRKVRDWPPGRTGEVHLKVVDQSEYRLLDADDNVIANRVDDYVPRCVPQEYGDYFVANIGEDGTIDGWHPTAEDVAEAFWPSE